MGAALPKAVESIVIERDAGKSFRAGLAEMNGWRTNMEDSHLIFIRPDWAMFGVFDGHGGDLCANFVAPRFRELLEEGGCPPDNDSVKQMFFKIDQEFLDKREASGATATMCIVRPPDTAGGKFKLHVINAGDSRVLLGNADGQIIAANVEGTDKGLTVDHKPNHPEERKRIERCGGSVQEQTGGVARVNGDLAVSRGFGDISFKETGGPGPEDRPVTVDPEMGHYECDGTDFLMLVCDGVSEGNFPNDEVVKLAASVLKETNDPGEASAAVIRKALDSNSKDNITCMVVLLNGIVDGQKTGIEFIPGPLNGVGDNRFMSAYTAMAARAHLTLNDAVKMRYEAIEEKLAKSDLESHIRADLESEINGIVGGTSSAKPGPKGSKEREDWFATWERRRNDSEYS